MVGKIKIILPEFYLKRPGGKPGLFYCILSAGRAWFQKLNKAFV